MKFKELQEKSEKELQELLAQTRESSRDLRFKIALGSLREVRKVRGAKKTIARVLTALNKDKLK